MLLHWIRIFSSWFTRFDSLTRTLRISTRLCGVVHQGFLVMLIFGKKFHIKQAIVGTVCRFWDPIATYITPGFIVDETTSSVIGLPGVPSIHICEWACRTWGPRGRRRSITLMFGWSFILWFWTGTTWYISIWINNRIDIVSLTSVGRNVWTMHHPSVWRKGTKWMDGKSVV